jgi:hypothetical protein
MSVADLRLVQTRPQLGVQERGLLADVFVERFFGAGE